MIYWPLAPVTLTHIILGIFRWGRTAYPIIAPYERITVIIPVYNEKKDITATLRAVLNQTDPPDQIIISDNGSQDETGLVIDRLLMAKGYALREIINQRDSLVRIGQYENNKAPSITIMQHRHQTSKADSINEIQKYKLIKNSRTLTIDSDTILDPRFIERMNENWYTLRIYRNRVVVNEAEILGATVLPKKNPGRDSRKELSRWPGRLNIPVGKSWSGMDKILPLCTLLPAAALCAEPTN